MPYLWGMVALIACENIHIAVINISPSFPIFPRTLGSFSRIQNFKPMKHHCMGEADMPYLWGMVALIAFNFSHKQFGLL